MKKLLILITILSIGFISCSKETDTIDRLWTDDHFGFQQSDLEYVKISEGTYFLYRDSASNNIDSVIVTKSSFEYKIQPAINFPSSWRNSNSKNYAYSYLNFSLILNKIEGQNQFEWFEGLATMNHPNAPTTIVINPVILSPFNALVLVERSSSQNLVGLSNEQTYNGVATGNAIPKIRIEGIEYTDVKIFKSGSIFRDPYNQYSNASTYYWAKGVGIIKRSLTKGLTTQTWTLVKKG